MAVQLTFTDNGDNTMTITSTTAGLGYGPVKITSRDPLIGGYNDTWKRAVIDAVLGTLYSGTGE